MKPCPSQPAVPAGLDFCNHASPSPCYWTVSAAAAVLGSHGSSSDSGGSSGGGVQSGGGDAISLVCPRRAVPAAGQELTIDYGGKSNEELMFLYGFAVRDNPAEVRLLAANSAGSACWHVGSGLLGWQWDLQSWFPNLAGSGFGGKEWGIRL